LFGSSLPEWVLSLFCWLIALLTLSVLQRYVLAFFLWSFFPHHSKGVLVGMLPSCVGDLFRGQVLARRPNFLHFLHWFDSLE
jgi:hypothetical protein